MLYKGSSLYDCYQSYSLFLLSLYDGRLYHNNISTWDKKYRTVIDLKTYLEIWVNSEGASPGEIAQRLQGIGFKPLTGKYDHIYDWKKSATIEEVLELGNTVHETLKGLKVLYKMETVWRDEKWAERPRKEYFLARYPSPLGNCFQLSQMPLFLQTIAYVLPLTYVSEGLRASMIFGQTQQALFNTALITALGLASIIVGSLLTKWEEDW